MGHVDACAEQTAAWACPCTNGTEHNQSPAVTLGSCTAKDYLPPLVTSTCTWVVFMVTPLSHAATRLPVGVAAGMASVSDAESGVSGENDQKR